ncbi:MAG: hypothetical protein A3I61_15640 [Acidobacteria bacterium RIFCSPLOWO2_02_FULL_68_18]|nr:MAG: hypothetical protein A3I61_15640 [Acidobacteria bacterium RIFCSPLOWO2_02_FULL_68_18]
MFVSGVAEANVQVLDPIPPGSAATWTYAPHDPCVGTRTWGEVLSPFDGSSAIRAFMAGCGSTCGSYFVSKEFNFGSPVDRQSAKVEFDGDFDLLGVISHNRAQASFGFFSGATDVGWVRVGYDRFGEALNVPAGTRATGRWQVGMTSLSGDPDRVRVILHVRSCMGGNGQVTVDNLALDGGEPLPPTTTLTFRPGPGANNGSDEGSETAGKDTWDWHTDDDPYRATLNLGSHSLLAHWNSTCNGWHARSYLQFDVSSLPTAADVTSVKLKLYMKLGGSYGAEPPTSTFVVQRVTVPWNEMTLTWNTRPPVSPSVEASVTLPSSGNPGFLNFAEIDITNLYKSWRDESQPNYGFAISRSNAVCENGNYYYFWSSDNEEADKRPALVITHLAEPEDTTAPEMSVPNQINAEATSGAGATVGYVASALDDVDGAVAVSCEPASGSTFPLGTTTVTCEATDAAGNTASASFDVAVVDTTPPVLTMPGDVTAAATGAGGAAVSFSATASDSVDASVDVACVPASGSMFPIGTTTVSCTATDDSGNSAAGSFSVQVNVTLDAVEALIRSWISNGGVANSVIVKLRHGSLGAFENELRAISGKWLTPAQAAELLVLASYL